MQRDCTNTPKAGVRTNLYCKTDKQDVIWNKQKYKKLINKKGKTRTDNMKTWQYNDQKKHTKYHIFDI